MKKLFIAVLAVAGLASCAQDEIISKNQTAIAFGDAFVDNSTKALYETVDGVTTEVQKFQVWGTVTGTGGTVALYDGALVKRPTDLATGYNDSKAWTCDVTRFWTPNCNYVFYAIVDAAEDAVTAQDAEGNRTGVPTSIAYTADGTTDLLYAVTEMDTKTKDNPGLVKFNMQHLLSRIQFTFANGVEMKDGDKGEYSFKVTSLSVKTWAAGDCAVPAKTWTRKENNEATLTFAATEGDPYVTGTASEGKVIIPGNQTLKISYTYEVYFDNDKSTAGDAKKIYTGTVTDKVLTHDFDVNHSYNIKATLTAGIEIEFTIASVEDWANANNPTTIQ